MNPMQMKWLISIVSRGKGEELAKLYAKSQIGAHLIVQGRGTASSDILHYLGLGSPEKDILLSLSPADLLAHKLPRVRELPVFSRAGHGIAFTIPLSGISLAAVRSIQADILLPDYSKEEPVMSQEITHDLIIAVVDDDNTILCLTPPRLRAAEEAPSPVRAKFSRRKPARFSASPFSPKRI